MADVTDRMVEAAQEWMRKRAGYLTLTDEAVRGLIEAALREQPAPAPVAWQWLDTGNFRKSLPASAEAGAWRPLYAHPPQDKPLAEPVPKALPRKLPEVDDD